eukprot:CAMPEP_0198549974 /NCGR_PEP_ID=MMETSP1462-20131121/73819_1 /TAXON_ID=1333877 /ORGANISM="Brandtodinium nutriculum, Strain RCC3387" /LENGTH=101 /DNA_ID=CAMNT_0044280569 /DNA_START=35 /DNA_END=337 /DNA_ORIENTATION=+
MRLLQGEARATGVHAAASVAASPAANSPVAVCHNSTEWNVTPPRRRIGGNALTAAYKAARSSLSQQSPRREVKVCAWMPATTSGHAAPTDRWYALAAFRAR